MISDSLTQEFMCWGKTFKVTVTFDAAHCVHMLSFWLITNYAFLQQTTSKKTCSLLSCVLCVDKSVHLVA